VGQSTPAGFAIDTKHVKTQYWSKTAAPWSSVASSPSLSARTRQSSFFGDLPFVGVLFRSKSKVSNKQEMLVFITPKMLTDRVAVSNAEHKQTACLSGETK